MTASPRELLSIIGPTASGKTQLSLELARRLDGEIISVDSRQVYRFMDVGTDKASPGVRREIPHHLIDVADPDETFSAADFAAGASRAVREILSRGKTPILAGGSPFYFKAFFTDVIHEGLERWDDSRGELEKEWDRGGSQELYRRLGDLDPEYASRIHPNDRFRIIRALSIIDRTGENPTGLRKGSSGVRKPFRPLYIGLYPGREALYRRIEERVRRQFDAGYPEEVARLLSMGFGPELPSMKGFGYRELAAFHRGGMTLTAAAEGDIRATKAFARRQMTWFRRFTPCLWYYVTVGSIPEIARKVVGLWEARQGERPGWS